MHPALSLILFTTSCGLGYGLAIVLGLGLLDPAQLPSKLAHMLALALIGGGLCSSLAHLGNPQRAWRALSQWRTSWLSREGVLALITFIPLLAMTWSALLREEYWLAAGLPAAAMSAVTVICTSMIYASLKSIDSWHTPLTPVCYLLFALMGGAGLGTAASVIAGEPSLPLLVAAPALTLAAWAARTVARIRIRRISPTSTPESATGLGHIGTVRLFERPHVTENYLTREMGYRVARRHAEKLWGLALTLGGLLPAALWISIALAHASGGAAPVILACTASILQAAGLLTDRWLFFAEARHAVVTYYGGAAYRNRPAEDFPR